MRKWRPTTKCIYVIPEIHGSVDNLKIILDRIIPLRFSIGQEDIVVFLGDFIDKGSGSAEVIDLILDLKHEYNDRVLCVKGNHEQILLNSLSSEEIYRYWLNQGGAQTLKNYLELNQLSLDPFSIPYYRFGDFIPKHHLSFFNSLPSHIIYENYIFFHGGFNTDHPIENTGEQTFIFDTNASMTVKNTLKKGLVPSFDDKYIYVGAHNYKDKYPVIYSKYMMLGGSAPQNLIVFEINSMSCSMIKSGKTKMYKHNFKYFA